MTLVTLHRINSISRLRDIDAKYGVEIDIRHNPSTDSLYLNHDPGVGDDFREYVRVARELGCPFMILNIKEAGIERRVIDIVTKYDIPDWFLLDVEFPFIYKASKGGIEGLDGRVAIRFSEKEPIEQALTLAPSFKWVWVDVNSCLPLTSEVSKQLRDAGYKLALVCPERWGRPEDIPTYIRDMKQAGIYVDTVMTAEKYAREWEESGVVL